MNRVRMARCLKGFGVAAACTLVVARVVGAHDFLIVPTAFENSEGNTIVPADSAAVMAVLDGYQRALARGDSAMALSLLARDAVILESGEMQSREEYRSHHLSADINFARAVSGVRNTLRVVVRGDVAWVSSTNTTRGEFHGRQINSTGAELVVLSRETDGWKIRAIHWSSRKRSP